MKTHSTWLFALGVAGLCLTLDPIATEARDDDPGPPEAAKEPAARFRTPEDAVVAFLEAAKAKDAVRLRNATSVRAPFEAMPKNQPLFTAILEQRLSETELTELAAQLDGFQPLHSVATRKSGQIRYLVMKPGPNGTQYVMTFTTRWQKEPGWEISDIGERRELVKPIPTQPKS